MTADVHNPERYVEAIRQSGLSIYDPVEMADPELWIPTPELEHLLNAAMTGISLSGIATDPIKSRQGACLPGTRLSEISSLLREQMTSFRYKHACRLRQACPRKGLSKHHGVQFLLELLGFRGRRVVIYLLRLGDDVLPD